MLEIDGTDKIKKVFVNCMTSNPPPKVSSVGIPPVHYQRWAVSSQILAVEDFRIFQPVCVCARGALG